MTKIVTVLAVLLICGSFAFDHSENHLVSQSAIDISKLKQDRLDVLKNRVDIIRRLVRQDDNRSFELIKPTIELIRVQIEYADSNEERRTLYDQWLEQHDRLVERAKRLAAKATISTTQAELNQLELKSERLRIEIERESLE